MYINIYRKIDKTLGKIDAKIIYKKPSAFSTVFQQFGLAWANGSQRLSLGLNNAWDIGSWINSVRVERARVENRATTISSNGSCAALISIASSLKDSNRVLLKWVLDTLEVAVLNTGISGTGSKVAIGGAVLEIIVVQVSVLEASSCWVSLLGVEELAMVNGSLNDNVFGPAW